MGNQTNRCSLECRPTPHYPARDGSTRRVVVRFAAIDKAARLAPSSRRISWSPEEGRGRSLISGFDEQVRGNSLRAGNPRGGDRANEMPTTLRTAAEDYLRAKALSRETRNEYLSTLRK